MITHCCYHYSLFSTTPKREDLTLRFLSWGFFEFFLLLRCKGEFSPHLSKLHHQLKSAVRWIGKYKTWLSKMNIGHGHALTMDNETLNEKWSWGGIYRQLQCQEYWATESKKKGWVIAEQLIKDANFKTGITCYSKDKGKKGKANLHGWRISHK